MSWGRQGPSPLEWPWRALPPAIPCSIGTLAVSREVPMKHGRPTDRTANPEIADEIARKSLPRKALLRDSPVGRENSDWRSHHPIRTIRRCSSSSCTRCRGDFFGCSPEAHRSPSWRWRAPCSVTSSPYSGERSSNASFEGWTGSSLPPPAASCRGRGGLSFLVTPQTLIRWYRERVRRTWTWRSRRPGQPPIGPSLDNTGQGT